MKFLVTGHTGFKGAWLVQLLVKLGHEVSGLSDRELDNSIYKNANLHKYLNHDARIDIRDASALNSFLKNKNFDVVMHLAAQSLVLEGYKNPVETFDTNIMGTANLLAAIKDYLNPQCILVVTTDKVYKEIPNTTGYLETDTLGGRDPYSVSKSSADLIAQTWMKINPNPPISIVRGGNVIGGGDWSENRLIPDVMRAIFSKAPLQLRIATAVRPWQHVLDCLNGYILSVNHAIENNESNIWNFGPLNSSFKTVTEVIDAISLEWGTKLEIIRELNAQNYESEKLLLNSTKSRTLLRWKENLSFSDSISWTVDFYRDLHKGIDMEVLIDKQTTKYLSL